MKNSSGSFVSKFDWMTLILYIIMLMYGLISICGATYQFDTVNIFSIGSRPMMQLVWIATAFVIASVVLFTDVGFIESVAPLFYISIILLLVLTIFIAPDIKGSRSWLVLGPIRLQPAEFAKVATSLALAWQLNKYKFEIKTLRSYIVVMSIVILPILLIIMQKETGSALVFFAFFIALYREGFSGLFLIFGASLTLYFVVTLLLKDVMWFDVVSAEYVVILSIIYVFVSVLLYMYSPRDILVKYIKYVIISPILVYSISLIVYYFYEFDIAYVSWELLISLLLFILYFCIKELLVKYMYIVLFALFSLGFCLSVGYVFENVLEPHQQVRIKISLGLEDDIRGKGYNVDQSKIAIGSGGLAGKGFLNGTQTKLNYVPEQATDFIFCTIGEEQGFLGSLFVIFLFASLILRLCYLSERQSSRFSRVYGYCVASIFMFHMFVNIGMVTGLLPVIGIPLPFFSYGGSSMWGFSLLLFIFLNLDAKRK